MWVTHFTDMWNLMIEKVRWKCFTYSPLLPHQIPSHLNDHSLDPLTTYLRTPVDMTRTENPGDQNPANANSTDTTLACPPGGGHYQSAAAAEIFLKTFAQEHHYGLSSVDSKPRYKKWKCLQGPNQKQLQKLVDDPHASIPTCPFSVSAKFESSDLTWTIIINHPTHDHGPISNLKPPKLPSLAPTQTKKRKQRSDAIVLGITHTHESDGDDETAQDPQEPVEDFNPLINLMKKLDVNARASLMGRFVRDCEVALQLTNSSKDHQGPAKIVSYFFFFLQWHLSPSNLSTIGSWWLVQTHIIFS